MFETVTVNDYYVYVYIRITAPADDMV